MKTKARKKPSVKSNIGLYRKWKGGKNHDAENAIAQRNGAATSKAKPRVNVEPIRRLGSQRAVEESDLVKSTAGIPSIAAELQRLQRRRCDVLKSRNMQANRLRAVVAGRIGYRSGMEEKERAKKVKEAADIIKAVIKGKEPAVKLTQDDRQFIEVSLVGISAFNGMKEEFEKQMLALAKQLPVTEWVRAKEQRGYGLLFLAITIGETGDLAGYANPGKVWRRMGCAPWTFDGKTRMGATWKGGREGRLPAEEWEKFGYSPRRRSIAYLIGEGLMKQNFVGADFKVETDALHDPDNSSNGEYSFATDGLHADGELIGATDALAADPKAEADMMSGESAHATEIGSAERRRGKKPARDVLKTDASCAGGAGESCCEIESSIAGPYRARYLEAKATFKSGHPEYSDLRCHRHGLLLAAKLLLKNLWIEWNGHPPIRTL